MKAASFRPGVLNFFDFRTVEDVRYLHEQFLFSSLLKGSATGTLPEDFDLREPVMFLPPFENSKDSPVLIAMQGEAQQQALAALLKTKTA